METVLLTAVIIKGVLVILWLCPLFFYTKDAKVEAKKGYLLEKGISFDSLDAKKIKYPLMLLPGYALYDLLYVTKMLPLGDIFKNFYHVNSALHPRNSEHINIRTKYMIAFLFSHAIFYTIISLTIFIIVLVDPFNFIPDFLTFFIPILAIVIILVAPLLAYRNCTVEMNKFREKQTAVKKQLPNAITMLALLTTSLYEPQQAWNSVAESSEGEFYREMKRTAQQLSVHTEPDKAYLELAERCKLDEVRKLVNIMLQGKEKTSKEMAELLRQMAHEAWEERKNIAMRNAEKANSLMLVPVMIMFMAVMIVIVAPMLISITSPF